MDWNRMHDTSTFVGRTQQILARLSVWKWWIAAVGLVTLFLLVALLSPPQGSDTGASASQPLLLSPSSPTQCSSTTSSTQKGTFVFRPEGPLQNYSNLYTKLDSLAGTDLRRLEVHGAVLDAPLFSALLGKLPKLETLVLENVGVSGNFSRVLLPQLTSFHYNQIRNAATDTYKEPHLLHSLLFFELNPNATWDFTTQLLNLPLDIKVAVGGTTILALQRAKGRVNLNVKTCSDLYVHLDLTLSPVTYLSLAWCPVTSATGLPLSTLHYLNLNNALPPTQVLAEVLDVAKKLQEFHAFLPDPLPISLNLTHLAPSVHTLSLSKLDLFPLPADFRSDLQSLTLEMMDLTPLLPNFTAHFPNLTHLALFNVSSEQGYGILEQIVDSSAEWILLPYFVRNITFLRVEALLTESGVGEDEEDILLERVGGKWVGRSLTPFELHFFRYHLLAFDDVDSFEDYMYWDAVFRTGHKHLRAWVMPIGT